jgi:hypothetical protein
MFGVSVTSNHCVNYMSLEYTCESVYQFHSSNKSRHYHINSDIDEIVPEEGP